MSFVIKCYIDLNCEFTLETLQTFGHCFRSNYLILCIACYLIVSYNVFVVDLLKLCKMQILPFFKVDQEWLMDLFRPSRLFDFFSLTV